MKELVLCRHAKSSWKHDVDDIYRPLNKRGIEDAPTMAKLWQGEAPDIVLCSPAVRTYATALAYIETHDWPIECFHLKHSIYEASDDRLLSTLQKLNRQASVWLVGHNPGLNDLCESLCDDLVEDIPTGARLHLACDIQHWSELKPGCAELMDYVRCEEPPST